MLTLSFTSIAIVSAFFAAIANILARTILKDLKSENILGINFLTMGAMLVLVSPFFYFFEPTPQALILVIMVGIIDAFANYFYFKTFEKTEAGIATPILSLAPLFTFLFGWIFLNDVVSFVTFAVAMLITLLIVVFSADFKNIKKFHADSLVPALTASALFGISAIPAKALLSSLEAINAPTLYMFRAGLIAILALVFFNFPLKEINSKQYRKIATRCLFVIVQWLLLYYALSLGNAGITVTLASITPVFVFIMGSFFLKEKITAKKVIASALVIGLLSVIDSSL